MTETTPRDTTPNRGAPIEVALSMLTLVRGGMGGSETYARALTRELATVDDVTATVYVPAPASGFSEGIPEVVVSEITGGASTAQRLETVARATLGAARIRRRMSSADVVHYPFTIAAPAPARRQALVQSVHDVQHLDLPQMFSKAELLFRRRFYEGTAKRADGIITVSEFAKGRIVDHLGIDPERIHVAYLGVDSASFVPHVGDRDDIVLYPARAWPHKNHARLVEAMRIVRLESPDTRLVLTGGGLERLGALPEWVDRRGLVSDDELRSLYRSARVLAFPSLYEGFGLPPLEAMASGCPAAVSDAGSLSEVCGDAAVTFDPTDPASIAAGILEAMRSGDRLAPLGLERAARFTWSACRDAHVDAYREAARIH